MITTSTAALRPMHQISASWLPRRTGAVMLITGLAILDILAVFALLITLSVLTPFAVQGFASNTPHGSVATTAGHQP